ncbi:duodenase-1 [Oryzias latipes]|uniref:trypsin n=1 Tax=Oryzias latipes TaxID=8090 RepID=A0A3B3IF42_ORYLA|nr:duodenase-1 [Oryzias latipes]
METMAVMFVLLFFMGGAAGSHIVGGRDAAPHSRPYMASLQVRGQHICGGALVREDFVLTAAHCDLPIPFTVVLGADLLQENEPSRQTFRVLRSIPHPNYNELSNDIMLLKLDGRARLTPEVQVIPLKSGTVGPASQCITAGWGDIGDNRTIANRLQEVDVTILAQRTCRQRWGNVRVLRSMVCGVGARSFQGFCSGDSGGPMICDGEAAGIVSFSGRRCGDPSTPDVYTRISSFRSWIITQFNNN